MVAHTRRWTIEVYLAALLLSVSGSESGLGLAGAVQAADLPVRIVSARVGFPGDDGQAVARFGQWAPLEATLQIQSPVEETAELAVWSPDTDGIMTLQSVSMSLTNIEAGHTVSTARLNAWAYIRPIGDTDVLLQVRTAVEGRPLSEPFRLRVGRLRDTLAYTVLFLGTMPQRFELPKPAGSGEIGGSAGLRGGRVLTATVIEAEQLPAHWFGYETVDLAVLVLGSECRTFLEQLWSDQAPAATQQRREALLEWVRRGGRLVVAGGSGAGEVPRWPRLQEILPATIRSVRRQDLVVLHWNARASSQLGAFHGALGSKQGFFPVADLVRKPHPAARLLIPPPERQHDPTLVPVAVQWPYGLGRVTLIAFDLHAPPFTDFALRAEFWDWVLREGGANRASAGSEGRPKPTDADLSEEEDELAVAVRTHADAFDGIPVISFGWVAVLVALYLLLVGPVEYLLLKRLIGRQEWTWAVFPVIVVTVAALAFAMAASFKGHELRLNKLDLAEIDVGAERVYGTTWLSLFSPRIERYTLSVMPHPDWAKDSAETVVAWWGAPRGPRAGLLPRQYRWGACADQPLAVLEEVPIQVWSTKAFVAHWSGRWPAGHPLVQTQLEHPPADPRAVVGTFTLYLPVPVLTDCVLFYAGLAYPVSGGVIHRGEPVRVVLDRGSRVDQWLQRESKLEELLLRVPGYRERLGLTVARGLPQVGRSGGDPANSAFDPAADSAPLPLLGLLFHEGALSFAEGVFPRNASLRRYDQSWRLHSDHTAELILVGRVTLPAGPAEEQLAGPSSPSLLWWRETPHSGLPRTPLPGRGRQETWVRIYLPIASSSTAGPPQP